MGIKEEGGLVLIEIAIIYSVPEDLKSLWDGSLVRLVIGRCGSWFIDLGYERRFDALPKGAFIDLGYERPPI
jgi:hypothetical protein